MSFGGINGNLFNEFLKFVPIVLTEISDCSLHICCFRNDIVGWTTWQFTDCECNNIMVEDLSGLNRMKCLMNVACCCDWIYWGCGLWPMPSLSFHIDLNSSSSSHHCTWLNWDSSLLTKRPIVNPINFFNSIQTSIFYHDNCSSWTFFCRLENDSNSLVRWYFIEFLL